MEVTSPPFARKNPKQLLLMAQAAQTFGQWPSSLLQMSPWDQQFNIACAVVLWGDKNAPPEEAESSNDIYW